MAKIRKKRGIPLDENFPKDTCRFILNDASPYLYCDEYRADEMTSYCLKHHRVVYKGLPARSFDMFKKEAA
jgi:hypothetical protein